MTETKSEVTAHRTNQETDMKHESKHEAKHETPAEAPSTEVAAPAAKAIAPLPEGASLVDAIAKVNELVERTNTKRDRGPTSTREMTDADAERIMMGDLQDAKHGKAAEVLGLSYGQVYSARKGFTYKTQYQKATKAGKSW